MQDLKEIISKYNALVEDINYYIDNRHKIGALSHHFHIRLFLNYIDLITSLIKVKISPKEKNKLKKKIEKLYPVIKEIHKKAGTKKVEHDSYFNDIESLLKELELKKGRETKIPAKHFEKIEEKKEITEKKHEEPKINIKTKNIFFILISLLLVSGLFFTGFKYIDDKPPYYITIPDINIYEDTSYELDLNNYFKDIDNKNLKFSSTKPNNINISISKEGIAKLTPKKDWNGLESVSFTATDFWNKKNSSNFARINVINTADCGIDGCEAGENCINCQADCGVCTIEKRKEEEDKNRQTEYSKKGIYEEKAQSYVMFGIAPIAKKYAVGRIAQTSLSPELININPVPCVRFEKEEKQLIFKELNISDIKIPRSYEKIIPAFDIDKCDGITVDYTIVVPKTYKDIKVLRCIGSNCIESSIKETDNLGCGKKTTRNEIYIEPDYFTMPVEEKKTGIDESNNIISSGEYKIRFYGDSKNKFSAEIKKPSEKIKLPDNQNMMIIGAPIMLKFDKKTNTSSEIIFPYPANISVDEGTIRLYIKNKNEWKYMGGTLNKNSKTLAADIKNIMQYADENNQLVIALMGSLCKDCSGTSFRRVYNPEIETKEAIILVHGLISSPETFNELIDDIKLTAQPWQVWVFGYPSNMNIEDIAKKLSENIQANYEEYDSITIVAHSLGGLIAQKTIDYSYKENIGTLKYSYISKVKKILLVGSPNKGTPAAELFYNVFGFILNKDLNYNIFDLNSNLLKNLSAGLNVPRIETINYYAITGTKPYSFNVFFFRENNTILINDGIVSTKSARTIGNQEADKKCIDYFEINLTHTELIDLPAGRKTIEKVVAKEVIDALEEIPVIGNNKYYDVRVENCSSADRFIVIGKKIKKEEVYDEAGCSCGNNVCGENENTENCPEDCFVYKKHKWLLIIISVLILVIAFITIRYRIKLKTKKQKPKIKKPEIKIKEKWNSIITNLKEKIKNIFEKIKQKKAKEIKKEKKIEKPEEKKEEAKEKKEGQKSDKEIREVLSKIETDIDKLQYLIDTKGNIKLKDAAKILGISVEQASEWARALECHFLVKLHYPVIGGPILIKIKYEEREKLKKKKEEE